MGCALTTQALTHALGARPLWHDAGGLSWSPRDPLPGEGPCDQAGTVDVAIVGAGFTGLWTAYYLKRASPGLDIVVLEAATAGFGASGRNGGWCSALFPASPDRMASLPGSSRAQAIAMVEQLRSTIDEVGRVCEQERIDCGFHRGGTVSLARNAAQWARARSEVAAARRWGHSEHDLRLLGAAEAVEVAHATRVRGATYTPHCAVLQPALLVSGLADVVEHRGVRIHERTRVEDIAPGRVRTSRGTVDAGVVVRATEGYTHALAGGSRRIAPVYSMMVATEPLDSATWAAIGLDDRPTFTDHRHVVIYGQRTADDRLAFGGRGAPYHFGSRTMPAYDRAPRVFGLLRETLTEMFPVLRGVRLTHGWGGPIGVSRDWCPSVGLDRDAGLAWAGGYVGDGVAAANLAGRTLADLVLDRDSDLVQLPWVGHRSKRWEPEPLRWLGINAGLRAMALADREERITGRPSLVARGVRPLVGG